MAHAGHVLARDMLDKLVSTRSIDVFLVPLVAVGIQIFLAVDKVKRRCDRRNKRAGGKFQCEHDGVIVGCRD